MALARGPALAGAPRDISAGPRTMRRPRGAYLEGRASARGTAHGSVFGVRVAHFGTPAKAAMCGPKRIVARKRLILEVTQYGHNPMIRLLKLKGK